MRNTVLFVITYAFFLSLTSGDNEIGTTYEEATTEINICFALDGSSSISPSSYTTQKIVVRHVVKGISTGKLVGLAAVQYGISVTSISPFTVDRNAFLADLESSEQLKSNGTFVAAGLNYCISELSKNCGGKNQIVLLGDGNSNVGRDPGDRASFFFRRGGVVITVGVGPSQNITALTNIAGNNLRRVFSINVNSSESDISANLSNSLFS